jgi:ParB-like chromosome segregation protein Spo0J
MSENGLISPLTTYCGEVDTGEGEIDRDDLPLEDLADRAESIHIVDGLSRLAAAESMGWPTLRCEIFRDEPDHISILSLAANTDRLPMSDYETVSAIAEYKELSGATLDTLSEKTGYAPSTLSNYLGALDAPEFITDAWQSKENDVELGHVVEIASLPTEDVQKKVLRDAVEYGRPVNHTREVARNAVKEASKEAQDDRTMHERQMDGQTASEHERIQRQTEQVGQEKPCNICGEASEAQVVLDVCQSDYGMIKQMQQAGAPILQAVQETASGEEPPERAEGD